MSKLLEQLRPNNNLHEIKSLYQKPRHEEKTEQPTFQVFKSGLIAQADLLFLPEDKEDARTLSDANLRDAKKIFWDSVEASKIKSSADKQAFKYVYKAFLDTDDKIEYVIVDVVKPSKISKQKKGLYHKYYYKKKYVLKMPSDKSDFEYTEINLLLNAKWVQWRKENVKKLSQPQNNNQDGYKYCLVVVDDHSRKCDAVALKQKDSETIAKGLKEIFSRGIVQKPKLELEVDDGNEFKGINTKEFNDEGVRIRRALPNRHRSQGLVEAKNKTIGTLLHQLQAITELETKQYSNSWVQELPRVIKAINENLPKPITTQKSDEIYTSKYNKDLLPIGTPVRVALDYPEDLVNQKRIDNKFRDSDIRFSRKVYKIKDIILKRSFPPMYLIDGDIETARTRNQLQVISHPAFV